MAWPKGRLVYVPLEPYKERYTAQLAAKDAGWLERNWKKFGVNYVRVDPTDHGYKHVPTIRDGQVLDAVGRTRWALAQTDLLLRMLDNGELTCADTIYLDDFFHPGLEALWYAFHQCHVSPKVYAYCWAQSVDCYDFTHAMAHWMRPLEKAYANRMDGIFVANTGLKDLLVEAGIGHPSHGGLYTPPVHVVGLPFDSEEVKERMPCLIPEWSRRKNQVVFSSRWDAEKDPLFFLEAAEALAQRKKIPADTTFVVCTASEKIRSNDDRLLQVLEGSKSTLGPRLQVRAGLTKEAYYQVLCESKVQFNCALQDWTSYTLLEASVAGCYPLYPARRSFPETFAHRYEFMYAPGDSGDAVRRLEALLLDGPLPDVADRSWVHKRHDGTWARMLRAMRFDVPGKLSAMDRVLEETALGYA